MGRKQAVNLALDADLLSRARALNLDLSQMLEPKLREVVASLEAEQWSEQHREAIDRYNRRIGEFGPVGAEHRRYG